MFLPKILIVIIGFLQLLQNLRLEEYFRKLKYVVNRDHIKLWRQLKKGSIDNLPFLIAMVLFILN